MFSFLKSCRTVFCSGCGIEVPASDVEGSDFSTSLFYFLLFDYSCPGGEEAVSRCGCDFHLPNEGA